MLPRVLPSSPRSFRRRRLIIIEREAPSITCTGDKSFEDAVVVSQLPEETSSEFARRALHRIAQAERTGRPFQEAYLCTAATDESATRAARRLITLGIAAHADATHSLNELVLCAPSEVDYAQRDALVRLADDAVLAGKDKPLRVRLCFVDDHPRLAPVTDWSAVDLTEDRVA